MIACVFVMLVTVTDFMSVLMNMKEANHKECQQDAGHNRVSHMIDVQFSASMLCLDQRVRYQM